MLLTIVLFILILGVIILIHEGGHFIFAKLTGVQVYEFSLGMGPLIFKKIAKDKTQYSLRAIPIGGYVSLAGEEASDEERKRAKGKTLQDKTVFQRFLVFFAGVGFNFISAFVILVLAGLIAGAPSTEPILHDVTEGGPAAKAGIEKGDEVLKINDHKITYLEDISLYLTVEDLNEPVKFLIKKQDGSINKYTLVPEKAKDENGQKRYVVGIVLQADVHKGFIESIIYGFKEECAIFKQMYVVLANLFTGGVSINQLSGPVGIYSIVGEMSSEGVAALLYLTALLSINVGVINLLPLPAFDGGRILFLIIEKIKGSPVNPKVENIIHTIGFVLLIILLLYVTWNDFMKLF